ncbi:MAG: tetratricopeptide repeat protein [Thermosynechococcaceae cyanobacterium]
MQSHLSSSPSHCNEAKGDTHYDRRSWSQAITAYTEAITLSPRYTALYYNRGMAHHYNGQTQSAISDLKEAAQLYLERSASPKSSRLGPES